VIKIFALVALAAAGPACSTLAPYTPPESTETFATIVDQPYDFDSLQPADFFRLDFSSPELVEIHSIDRMQISRKSRNQPDRHIVLKPGIRKLEVRACKSWFDLTRMFDLRGGWHCGRTVLRLEAQAGLDYRVSASFSKEDRIADLWIEDVASQEIIAGSEATVALQ